MKNLYSNRKISLKSREKEGIYSLTLPQITYGIFGVKQPGQEHMKTLLLLFLVGCSQIQKQEDSLEMEECIQAAIEYRDDGNYSLDDTHERILCAMELNQ